ncbi:MAG: hypothetical protein AB7L13_20390 [Acidimicrobiia bacterium]
MAIRDKMRANAQSVLEPGETVQQVFGAQRTSGWMALISFWIIIIRSTYRVVVVTDRRILLCESGRITTTPVKKVINAVPRATRLGPPTGLWYKTAALGETIYVHKRFHKDIEAADAAIGA